MMDAKELGLDYFKIYDVEDHRVRYRVALKGQFDAELEEARLLTLSWFANPARKGRESGYDSNAHFTWYQIYERIPEPTREVMVKNQFGQQTLVIGAARGLLVPALKKERGQRFPEKLDHYKLYQVLQAEPARQAVLLTDQFDRGEDGDQTEISYPIAFGVPVSKVHLELGEHFHPGIAEEGIAIHNEKAHLVIYRINPRRVELARGVRDQFATRRLHFLRSVALAAPSLKLEWKEF